MIKVNLAAPLASLRGHYLSLLTLLASLTLTLSKESDFQHYNYDEVHPSLFPKTGSLTSSKKNKRKKLTGLLCIIIISRKSIYSLYVFVLQSYSAQSMNLKHVNVKQENPVLKCKCCLAA